MTNAATIRLLSNNGYEVARQEATTLPAGNSNYDYRTAYNPYYNTQQPIVSVSPYANYVQQPQVQVQYVQQQPQVQYQYVQTQPIVQQQPQYQYVQQPQVQSPQYAYYVVSTQPTPVVSQPQYSYETPVVSAPVQPVYYPVQVQQPAPQPQIIQVQAPPAQQYYYPAPVQQQQGPSIYQSPADENTEIYMRNRNRNLNVVGETAKNSYSNAPVFSPSGQIVNPIVTGPVNPITTFPTYPTQYVQGPITRDVRGPSYGESQNVQTRPSTSYSL